MDAIKPKARASPRVTEKSKRKVLGYCTLIFAGDNPDFLPDPERPRSNHNTKCQIPSAKYQVPKTRYQVPSTFLLLFSVTP